MHEKIIMGKLNSVFYEQCFLPSMQYILSNESKTVARYWEEVEADLGKEIYVESSLSWQCK
jgi:translation elongation factor EF-Ts